jgi:hypothetical protein
MATRYRPNGQFAVYVDGTPRVFKPDYIDPASGLQGYDKSALAGLSKEQRASFTEIQVGSPVEQATAAPGEKRTRKRTKKPAPQTVSVEPAVEAEEASGPQ